MRSEKQDIKHVGKERKKRGIKKKRKKEKQEKSLKEHWQKGVIQAGDFQMNKCLQVLDICTPL